MGAPWKLPFGVSGPIDRFGFGWRASFVVPGTGHEGQVHYTVGHRARRDVGVASCAFPRFVFVAPVLLLLAVFVVVRQRRDARVWLLVGMIATSIVGYFFVVGRGQRRRVRPATSPSGPSTTTSRSARSRCSPRGGCRSCGRHPRSIAVLADRRDRVDGPGDRGSCCTMRAMPDNARAAEVALTDAPGRRLVLQDPMFPRRPVRARRERRGSRRHARRRHRHPRPPPRRRRTLPRPRRVPRARLPPTAGDTSDRSSANRCRLEIVEGDAYRVDCRLATARRTARRRRISRIGDDEQTTPGPTATWTDHRRPISPPPPSHRGRLPDRARRVRRVPLRRPPHERDGACACSRRATAIVGYAFPTAGPRSHRRTSPIGSMVTVQPR